MIYSPTKPGISAKIDWSDPLSQGLVGAWLLNEGGGKRCLNFVTNTTAGLSGAISLASSGLVCGGGYALESVGYLDDPCSVFTTLTCTNSAGGILVGANGFENLAVGITTGAIGVITYSSSVSYTTTETIPLNVKVSMCHQIASTYKRVYLNGQKLTLNNETYKAVTAATATGIGARNNGTSPFAGTIHLVLIYNRALSATEILQLHELTKGW